MGEVTAPYFRELQLHCYRMLGSLADAEDILQETLIASWRGLDGFEGRVVLGYSTAEVAAMLGTSQTAIKGCLQRARASLERHRCPRSAATSPAPGSRSGSSPDC